MSNPSVRPVRTLLLLSMLAVVTLGACSGAVAKANDTGTGGGSGSQPTGGGGSQPIQPDDPITGPPVPIDPWPMDPPFPSDGATHVLPDPTITDGRPHAIDHISVAADGVTVTVYWWGGVEGCYGLQEVQVLYDENGVPTITVLEGSRPAMGDFLCIEIAVLKATTITLAHPLFIDSAGA